MDAPDDAPPLPDLTVIADELTGVDAALARVEDGSYGRCEVCGAALDGDALDADPIAVHCDTHAPG